MEERAEGDDHRRHPDDDGADCLEAALWAFHRSDSFKDGALLAVNLGDDADTTCAVFGQLAGAFYGMGGIPEEWRATLAKRDLIEGSAKALFTLSSQLTACSEEWGYPWTSSTKWGKYGRLTETASRSASRVGSFASMIGIPGNG
jgi:hypothetical protein